MAVIRDGSGEYEVSDALADYFGAQPGHVVVVTADEAAELKGEELDAALEDADLPKSGKADEKRARLVGAAKSTDQGAAQNPED